MGHSDEKTVKAIIAVGDDGHEHILRADHYLKEALQKGSTFP